MSVSISVSQYGTCLVYHVDKGLCVVPKEGTDRVTLVLTREDRLDQGGEFVQGKCASDQTSTGWSIKVGKVGEIEERLVFLTRSAKTGQ